MPIIGLTDQAAAFPIIGQLRKGEKKTSDTRPGKDLTYFRFTSEDQVASQMFAQAYPDQESLRHINVFLPHRTTDENIDAWMEEWVAGGLVHRCDGVTCVLWRKPDGSYSTEPKPCQNCQGKQVGRLSTIVPELGRLATVTILTTSIHDIKNLTQQLRSYEALNGDLRGIPFVVTRRPVRVSTPTPNGKRVRREKWLLSIETQPRWTMAQLAAMERAALPETVEEGAEEGSFVEIPRQQMPDGITNPYIEDEPPGEPQSTKPDGNGSPKNGKNKKKRPLDPDQLYEFLHRRVEEKGDDDAYATQPQIGLLTSKLEECFAPDEDARDKRLAILGYIWDVESAKELTKIQAQVTLDWLLEGDKDGTGDYPLHQAAPEEARRIYREACKAQGQIDMFEDEDELDAHFGVRNGGAAYAD